MAVVAFLAYQAVHKSQHIIGAARGLAVVELPSIHHVCSYEARILSEIWLPTLKGKLKGKLFKLASSHATLLSRASSYHRPPMHRTASFHTREQSFSFSAYLPKNSRGTSEWVTWLKKCRCLRASMLDRQRLFLFSARHIPLGR